MFNKIAISRHFDIGSFAEAMLFYGHIQLIFDVDTLLNAVRSIGPDNLLLLLDQENVAATCLSETLLPGEVVGAKSLTSCFVVVSNRHGKADVTDQEFLEFWLQRYLGKSAQARQFILALISRLRFLAFSDITFAEGKFTDLVGRDLRDRKYTSELVRHVVSGMDSGLQLPEKLRYHLIPKKGGLLIQPPLFYSSSALFTE